jgi:mono/diheme cytochrome c family protein
VKGAQLGGHHHREEIMKLGFRAAWSLPALLMLSIIIMPNPVRAQGGAEMSPTGQITSGKLDFREYCAQCHGKDGTGDGPVAPALKKKPANLTLLSKNNGGVFPDLEVSEFIDGTKLAEGHGTREMPIWGYAFLYRQSSHTGHGGAPLTEAEVKHKIARLVEYVKSLQVQ